MTGVGDHSWPQHSRCIQAGGPFHPDRAGSPCPAELSVLRPNKERSDLPSLWRPTLRIGQRIPGVSPFLALVITIGGVSSYGCRRRLRSRRQLLRQLRAKTIHETVSGIGDGPSAFLEESQKVFNLEIFAIRIDQLLL